MAGMLGRRFVTACLVALFGAGAAHAGPPQVDPLTEPRFESIGSGAIPQGVISALAQDRAGFLWLGTGAGLVRYDGYHFRQQGRQGEAAAQTLGFIRTLLPARDGRLWIGTEADGLAAYDPVSETVTLYRSDLPAGQKGNPDKAGPAPTIRALAEDGDGVLWVGSVGGGLDRFDPATTTFTRYRHSAAAGSLPDDRGQSLLVDSEGTLWIGGWQGLSRKPRGSETFEPVFSGPGGVGGKNVLRLFQA